jgi:hypothetical protein
VGNQHSRIIVLGVLSDGSARSCREIGRASGLSQKRVENSIYLCWLRRLVIRTASPIFEQETVNVGRRGRVVHTRPYHLYLLAPEGFEEVNVEPYHKLSFLAAVGIRKDNPYLNEIANKMFKHRARASQVSMIDW